MGKESIIHTGASKDAHDMFVSTVDSLVIAGLGKETLHAALAGMQTPLTMHEGHHTGAATTAGEVDKSDSLKR